MRALAAQCERWPALEPLPERAWDGLGELDSAFAAAVYDAAVRRWLTLGWLIESCAGRPMLGFDVPVRAAMLAGAAQLFFLDRVPAHAAIDRSVEWAKAFSRGSGVVNAVLRKVARVRESASVAPGPWDGQEGSIPLADGSVMRVEGGKRAPGRAAWVAAATSHPRPLVQGWMDRHGEETGLRLALHGVVSPPTLICTGWVSAPVEAGPTPDGLTLTPHRSGRHAVAEGPRAALSAFLSRRPDVWVQDAGSSAAVAGVADLSPGLIIDACAGRGTKTRQLAAVFPKARILATDVDPSRQAALRRRFEGHASVRVATPEELPSFGRPDLVLIDVPCGNSGTLARRVEARYRFEGREGPRQMARLVEVQRAIASDARSLLAPGGAVLYSTCSIEPAENEDQWAWASQALGVSVERRGLELPAGLPGEPPSWYQDGGGWALWRAEKG